MRKRNMCLLIVVLMMCMAPSTVFAGEWNNVLDSSLGEQIFYPDWVGVETVTPDLLISNGKAQAVVTVLGNTQGDNVKFNINLQQYNNNKWISIKNWNSSQTISKGKAVFNQSYSITKGYNYRYTGTVKMYKGSTLLDTINVTSNTESY